jgi:hypothetical protein
MSENRLDLTAGSPLELESTTDDITENLHAKILDFEPDKGILISHPETDGVPVTINSGDRFFACFRQGDADVTFETEVTRVLTAPYQQLLVGYPEHIRPGPLRQNSRVAPAPASLRLIGNGSDGVSLRDISCSGASLVADRQLGAINEIFQMEIKAEGEQTYTPLDCMVIHVKYGIREGRQVLYHGVVFAGMDAETQLFIWKFVQRSKGMQ